MSCGVPAHLDPSVKITACFGEDFFGHSKRGESESSNTLPQRLGDPQSEGAFGDAHESVELEHPIQAPKPRALRSRANATAAKTALGNHSAGITGMYPRRAMYCENVRIA